MSSNFESETYKKNIKKLTQTLQTAWSVEKKVKMTIFMKKTNLKVFPLKNTDTSSKCSLRLFVVTIHDFLGNFPHFIFINFWIENLQKKELIKISCLQMGKIRESINNFTSIMFIELLVNYTTILERPIQ